ncbi:MAG: hypothetical protein AAFZ05_07065, partial [Pseudomonadota bacterium]
AAAPATPAQASRGGTSTVPPPHVGPPMQDRFSAQNDHGSALPRTFSHTPREADTAYDTRPLAPALFAFWPGRILAGLLSICGALLTAWGIARPFVEGEAPGLVADANSFLPLEVGLYLTATSELALVATGLGVVLLGQVASAILLVASRAD